VANYNVDIQLQVQGLKKVQDLDKTVEKLNQETKKLQARLTGANPFNATGALKLNRAVQDGIKKTETLSRRNKISADIQKRNLNSIIKLQKELNRVTSQAQADRERRGGPSSPIKGSASMPGSPKALSAQRKARTQGFSNLALGVGFPLLFGGGVGSVAGGALGSVGGMGGQVLGSALGGIIDQVAENIAKLGQALNPFTADIKAVTAAAGESGTAFERLVVQLEEVAGKEKALEVATAQLATVIGREGVDALKEFGDASSDLSNELSKSLTALGAALAPLLADITRATANAVERSRLLRRGSNDLTNDPGVQQIRRDLSERKIGELEAEDRIVKLIREKELEEQIGIAKQAQADIQAKINEKTSSSIALKEQELVITQNGGDILNEQVQTALQNIDAEKVRLKVLEAQGDELKLNLAYAEGQLLFAIRTAKIEAATEARRAKEQREANAAAREAEAARKLAAREQEARERKRKQLATGLLGEYISQVGIISQTRQLGKTELVQLDEQRSAIELIYQARVKQVKIATEDASLESAKLETLKQRRSLELEQIQLKEKQIELEGRLNPLNGDPAVKGVRAGFKAAKEADEKLQEQANKLDNLYKGIGNTIQTGIVDAIDTGIEGLINGTKDLGESLQEIASGVLKDIGRQLLSFGVKLGLQALTGGGGSFFAEGGYVTGPTNAVIGEGGEPEYVIPESKMRESMGRYSRGSRGNSVIPANGGGGDASGGGTATLAPIDVRYTVERINSVDYVTADQFQAGMREAASSGARQGEQRALSTLRQNTTQRRRIGI